MKTRSLLILAVSVLAICLGSLWYLQAPPAAPTAPVPGITFATTPPPVAPPTAGPTPQPPKVAGPGPKPKTPPKPLTEWEMKIETLLRSNINETETAQLLINMLPTLPAEGQSEAAQHISNLLLDKDYSRLMPLVKNTALPAEVLEVFVNDLLNRDDRVKLPTLLEIAKLPGHPQREEALQDLQIFLDGDFGSDWNKWDAAMKDYLVKQAQEEAAIEAAPPTIGQPKPPRPRK